MRYKKTKENKMAIKKLNQWNHINKIDLPKEGQVISLNYQNEMYSDKDKATYVVGSVDRYNRGDFHVWCVQGKRLLADGKTYGKSHFELFFTDKETKEK